MRWGSGLALALKASLWKAKAMLGSGGTCVVPSELHVTMSPQLLRHDA